MFEMDPNNPFDLGDPAAQKVVGIFAIVSALIAGLIFLASCGQANAQTATESTVAIMGAMGFTYCFVAVCAAICVCVIVTAVQRGARHSEMIAHQEKLEQMRLANTKEITVPRS